jgi:hypothetical protein
MRWRASGAMTESESQSRATAPAFLYAIAILYVSTVLGPDGFTFVPISLGEAWHRFLDTRYVINGSDQRSDWNGNLAMFLPMGWLLAAAYWPRRGSGARWFAAGAAFACCLGFLLVVKYLQLFFPPRTVTINYIVAQTIGSAVGIALYASSRHRLYATVMTTLRGGRDALPVLLAIYAAVFIIIALFPFNFALSLGDLRERLSAVPADLLSMPLEDRSRSIRLVFILISTAAMAPIGMLIALRNPYRPVIAASVLGFLLMTVLTIVQMFILSATPHLVVIPYRTAGIVAGAWLWPMMRRIDLPGVRSVLRRLVPLAIPLYIVVLLVVNDVASTQWRTVDEALASFDTRLLLPFWNHYIVSKSQAMQSVVVHAVMYAPVGIMVWLVRGDRPGGAWFAAMLALPLSFAIEIGRWFRPELQPDFTNSIVATIAAAAFVKWSAFGWRTLEATFGGGEAPRIPRAPDVELERSAPETIQAKEPYRPEKLKPPKPLQLVASAVAVVAVAALGLTYSLGPLWIFVGLIVYAVILWLRPDWWLVAVPALLPVLDLTRWSGSLYLTESDFIVLATVAVLSLRLPPDRRDFRPPLPLLLIVLLVFSYTVSVTVGLTPFPPIGANSFNNYFSPYNALRVAKGFFWALLLLPFLARSLRSDRGVRLFASGMVCGLAGVGLVILAERAIFVGLFDFSSDFRVTGPFTSMHIGGGHLGAYLIMALPFLAPAVALSRRPVALAALSLAFGLTVYAIAVSFNRTVYGAAIITTLTFVAASSLASLRGRGSATRSITVLVLAGGALVALVGAAALSPFMSARLSTVSGDWSERLWNWNEGLSLRDGSWTHEIIGMGIGSYPRRYLFRSTNELPTVFAVARDGERPFLRLGSGLALYLGQYVALRPDQTYKLSVALRATSEQARLSIMVCEKALLYSFDCREIGIRPEVLGQWHSYSVDFNPEGLGHSGDFVRPVEFALASAPKGTEIDITALSLRAPSGEELLANGDFARGTDRWLFTDDYHWNWRIEDQPLMTLFEQGWLGVLAIGLVVVLTLVRLLQRCLEGDTAAPVFLASIIGFLFVGVFNSLFEAPRLASVFYLVVFAALCVTRPAPKILTPAGRGRVDRTRRRR